MPSMAVKVRLRSFFDRPEVIHRMSRRVHTILNQSGRRVMYYMREHMPYRRAISQPGDFPHSHIGLLRQLLFYEAGGGNSVIVGPTLIPRTVRNGIPVPRVLNDGAVLTRRAVFDRQRRRYRRTNRQITERYRPRPFIRLTLPFAAETLARITGEQRP